MANILEEKFNEFVNDLIEGDIKELAPPFNDYYDNDNDILTFYNQYFDKYIKYINSLDKNIFSYANKKMYNLVKNAHPEGEFSFDILSEIYKVCSTIENSIDVYFAGYPGEAFNKLYDAFSENKDHLLLLLPQLTIKAELFRVRKGRDFSVRKDLFHIPFELRSKCGSYRFSMPGYPSLYLAGSLQTALDETLIEDKNFTCCAFKNKSKDGFVFIDLTLPEDLNILTFDQKYNFVVFYPLIVACELSVKQKDDPFKPEYVIPQLFYQVIHSRPKSINGICNPYTKENKLD